MSKFNNNKKSFEEIGLLFIATLQIIQCASQQNYIPN